MFRIFRKVRADLLHDSRGKRYGLYAVGELLLVVAGILIALQVNNWNEERLEQRQIRQYAIGLISDLQRDILMLEPITRQMERTLSRVRELGDYTYGKSLDEIDSLRLWILTPSFGYRPYEWNRTAMEQMKNAGALREIRNRDLAEKITAYEALTRHLDEDYRNDVDAIDQASDFADFVVDGNYPSEPRFAELRRITSSEPTEERIAAFRADYPVPDLPLLTDDINDIRILVNKYDKVGSIRARVENEVPRLIGMAEELMRLLADEYSIEDPQTQ